MILRRVEIWLQEQYLLREAEETAEASSNLGASDAKANMPQNHSEEPASRAGSAPATPTSAVDDGSQRNRNRASKSKRRWCTSYTDVNQCHHGAGCATAHSREEIGVPLLSTAENQEQHALTDDFFMYKYKMTWCPIHKQHDWHTCVYAHTYQDARRPATIGYGAMPCPYWSHKDTGAEYSHRCPLGLRCPYSHGAKEQLYHPHYFKTVMCGQACADKLCPCYHQRHERRTMWEDDIDYTTPLPVEVLPESWVTDFLMQAPGQMQHSGQNGQMQCGQMPFFPMLLQNSPSLATQSHGMSADIMLPWVPLPIYAVAAPEVMCCGALCSASYHFCPFCGNPLWVAAGLGGPVMMAAYLQPHFEVISPQS
ncbi:unnamed protein product [Symbiodinium sp. CCMP2592]|nr:unnamed protein product [Symbiodinium sp. CCMP2592]